MIHYGGNVLEQAFCTRSGPMLRACFERLPFLLLGKETIVFVKEKKGSQDGQEKGNNCAGIRGGERKTVR